MFQISYSFDATKIAMKLHIKNNSITLIVSSERFFGENVWIC